MKHLPPKPDGRIHPKAIFRAKYSKEDNLKYVEEMTYKEKINTIHGYLWPEHYCPRNKGKTIYPKHSKADPRKYSTNNPSNYARCFFCNKKIKCYLGYVPSHKAKNKKIKHWKTTKKSINKKYRKVP